MEAQGQVNAKTQDLRIKTGEWRCDNYYWSLRLQVLKYKSVTSNLQSEVFGLGCSWKDLRKNLALKNV